MTNDDSQPGRSASEALSILLAEDMPDNVKVATLYLRKLGYDHVDVVGNGREAISALERKSYDVILMDIMMPEMDGYAATTEICQRWARPTRPTIIAVTANAMPGDRQRCLDAGMDDYIPKPLRIDRLRDALAEVSERRGKLPPR